MPCIDLRFLVVKDPDFQRNALEQMLIPQGSKAVQGPFISRPLQAGTVAARLMRRHAPQPPLSAGATP